VKPRTRVSPHLEHCALRLSANESFAHAERDLEVLTGLKLSRTSQNRRAKGATLEPALAEKPVQAMSIDGGKVRLRDSAATSASRWRDYKVAALHGECVAATFQDNARLVAWVKQQPRAKPVSCLGDGHPGIWNLAADCFPDSARDEVLDWFHLMENLHRVGGSNRRLASVRHHLWHGRVDAAQAAFDDWEAPEVTRFRDYLNQHRARLPDYAARQAADLPIGSGTVESAVKQIGARLKLAGARWLPSSVNPMLRLRSAYLNGNLNLA